MQAVILAAGQSSRLRPFSDGRHKSFLSILGKPLLVRTISAIKRAGITDIILITDNKEQARQYLGTGENMGISITYVVQKEALGMGSALLQVENFLADSFIVTAGYHVDADILIEKLFSIKDADVALLLKKRSDYEKLGVVDIDGKKVLSVTEKPKKNSDTEKLCIVGLYLLTRDFVDTLKKTELSHYNLEIALSSYANKKDISYAIIDETVSLKYPWDLLDVKDYLLNKMNSHKGKQMDVAKSAELVGNVFLGDNVKIFEGAKILGPCFIGNNATIGTNAIIRNGTVIEDNCVVGAQMEVKNSILMSGTTTHSGFIGDSVIGENCKIAAQFTTANVRLDRKNITVYVKDEAVDTGKRSLGVLMGSKVVVGINCSVMPGVIVGNNVVIGPSTTVRKNIGSNIRFYTKFQEIVEEEK